MPLETPIESKCTGERTTPVQQEFEALRNELLRWQDRRFQVLALTIPFVGTAVGALVAKSSPINWRISTSLVLIFLASSASLIRLFAVFNSDIGAYLEVFHGSGWEDRISRYRRVTRTPYDMNQRVAGVFFVFALACCVLLHGKGDVKNVPPPPDWLVCGSAGYFLVSMGILAFTTSQKERARLTWEEIKKRGNTNNRTKNKVTEKEEIGGAETEREGMDCLPSWEQRFGHDPWCRAVYTLLMPVVSIASFIFYFSHTDLGDALSFLAMTAAFTAALLCLRELWIMFQGWLGRRRMRADEAASTSNAVKHKKHKKHRGHQPTH